MLICWEPQTDGTLVRSDLYEYRDLSEVPDDFGEENVFIIAKGIVFCTEDERDDNRAALIVADISQLPPGDPDTIVADVWTRAHR